VNSRRFAALASKFLTTSTSGYTGLLLATETALNCETLARIAGANVLFARAVGLAYYIAMPGSYFFTQRTLADILHATAGIDWTVGTASAQSASGIGGEYRERENHYGLNLTDEVVQALRNVGQLERRGAAPLAEPRFEVLIVDYAIRWTRCAVILRAFHHDGVAFETGEISGLLSDKSAPRPDRTDRDRDMEINWLVRQLGAQAAMELAAAAKSWKKQRSSVTRKKEPFQASVEAVEALLARKSNTDVRLRARSYLLAMRILDVLSAFRVPFDAVAAEYKQLAVDEDLPEDARAAWYAAHRVVQMTDREIQLYFA